MREPFNLKKVIKLSGDDVVACALRSAADTSQSLLIRSH